MPLQTLYTAFMAAVKKSVFVVNFSGNFEPGWSLLLTCPDCINNRKYLGTQEAMMWSWPQKSSRRFQNNSKACDSVHDIKFSIYFSPLDHKLPLKRAHVEGTERHREMNEAS